MRSKTLKDIAKVVASNIISLVSGILVAFLLPKITTVSDFGYYKTFTLYVSYIGLLHFGFCDGVYLMYGGWNYEDLPLDVFRMYFKVLTVMETAVTIAIIVVTGCVLPDDLHFIFYCLALYSLFHIYSSYYQLVSQATSRFNEFSLRTIIYSVLRFLGLVVLWIYAKLSSSFVSYEYYVGILVVLEIALAIWYFNTYFAISFGKSVSIRENKHSIVSIYKLGFPLLITNLASTFLLTLDRQFVNILFSKEDYAIYAFAYSMLSLVTTTTSAVATVLFPKLKRSSERELENTYSRLIATILIVVYAGLIVFFPLKWFVNWFLPQYSSSIIIFRVIFPGLAISSAITIVMYNYYKVLNKTTLFLKISIGILLLSGIANYVAYKLFGTTVSISIASIITMMVWYVISERLFVKRYSIKWVKNIVYLLIMMLGFYGITTIENILLSGILYLVFFVIMIFIMYKDFTFEAIEKYIILPKNKKK